MTAAEARDTAKGLPPRLVTFTNLFPSAARPTHGLFVQDRVHRLAAALGWDWQVVCPVPKLPRLVRRRADRWTEQVPEREIVDGVTVHHPRYRHLPGLSLRAQAGRLRDGARAVLGDLARGHRLVLDIHYAYPDGVAGLELAAEFGCPAALTARGSDVNVLAQRQPVVEQLRAAAPHAAAFYAVAEALRAPFASALGVPVERVGLARNGVDLERFRPGDAGAARRALGLPEDAALVVGVGRLVDGKGFHLMARALRDLPAAVHFAVAGAGPEAERLRSIAPEGRLHLLGARPPEQVALLLQAADLLVLPSAREGWPNVVTEALASGCRVVATAVGAVPEMLTAPFVGAMIRAGDHRALGREVLRLLQAAHDPDQVRDFAQRFSWQAPIQMLAADFRQMLG